MSMTRAEIKSMAIRLGKIPATNATALAGVDIDSGIACNIIAGLKEWPELFRLGTFALTSSDTATTQYPLASDVDKVQQLRITSPTNYTKIIYQIALTDLRAMISDKTLAGRTTPSYWAYSEPTISSNNTETKKVEFDYLPDQAYTITYSYKGNPPVLDEDGDYPFFDGNFHHIVALYDLWKYAERVTDAANSPIYWRGEWENGLKELLDAYYEKTTMLLPIGYEI